MHCTSSTIWAVIAAGTHLFPFRTEKLSPPAPMVLGTQVPGRSRTPPTNSRGNRCFPPRAPLPLRAGTDRPRLRPPPGKARLRPQACAFPSTYTRCHGAARWRSRLASVDRGRCRRDGHGLQRLRCCLLDPYDPHPYTAEHALAFIRREVLADHEAMAMRNVGRVVGGIGIGLNDHEYRATIGYWVAAANRGEGVWYARAATPLETRRRGFEPPARRSDH